MKARIALSILACVLACTAARANIYVVGETNTGTKAILFLDYNSYGSGTWLFATSLTLKYPSGDVETLLFKGGGGDEKREDTEGSIDEHATQMTLKGKVWHLTSAFSGRWGSGLFDGSIEMNFSGPSNSQKGVEDIDRANEINQMTIKWIKDAFWPRNIESPGPLVFRKLKLYGYKGDDATPEFFDGVYDEKTENRISQLLKPTILGEEASQILFEDTLDSSYIVQHNKATAQLHVQMTFSARFGRQISSAKLADLDLKNATITEESGGAFAGSVAMVIPVKKGATASIRSWPARSGLEIYLPKEMTTDTHGSVVLHFQDLDKAKAALAELASLAKS